MAVLIASAFATASVSAATIPDSGPTVKAHSTLADPGFFRTIQSRASRSEVRLPLPTNAAVTQPNPIDDRIDAIKAQRAMRAAVAQARLHAAQVARAKALAAKRAHERAVAAARVAHYASMSPAAAKAYAHTLVSSGQFGCLDALWMRESGWNMHASNPSGAYGIPQALPGSKMGPGWQSSAIVQIRWGLSYIASRYGTPCGALAHSDSHGWY